MSTYTYFPTPRFSSRLKKVGRQDPPGHRRIMQVIDRLLESPADADGKMRGVHHGRFKKYVGRRDYRLIYRWCEFCRKEVKRLEHHCGACGEVSDHVVIFFDLYHKNEQEAHLRHLVE